MLERLLALYPAQARPLAPPTPLANAGGFSGARLWRFDSGLGPLVAREWPAVGPSPDALRRIHGWLVRLADLDFIPQPLTTLDGRTLVTHEVHVWEVTRWLPGLADASRPPSRPRLRAAFTGLAAVHQRLAFESSRAAAPGLATRLAEANALIASELDTMESHARRDPTDPLSATAFRWITLARSGLPALIPRLHRDAARITLVQPVLRDARAEHFLFTDDQLTGLVDFGAIAFDPPAADLARLLNDWVGRDRIARADALDAYAAVRLLDSSESALIDIFADSSAWLGPARWVRWHFVEHRRFDDPDAVRLGLERAMRRLTDRLTS
jgi:homoserine kinase type II